MLLGWRDVPVDNSRSRRAGEEARAGDPAGVHRPRPGRHGHRRARAQALHHPQELRPRDPGAEARARQGVLRAVDVGAHRSATRACCSPTRSASTTSICKDPRVESALALVHQRFSTNTFPTLGPRAPVPHDLPQRRDQHRCAATSTGSARARARSPRPILGKDLDKIWPLIYDGQSDSASFDNALELLVMGGYSVAHAMMMMIPEAWENHTLMDPARRAFYEYHAAMMEPWDGPASIAFTDGRQIGATLDRNGLRPSRYIVTDDDLVIMGSECGCLPIPEEKIVKKWRLQPGKMFLVDLEKGRIVDDKELKDTLAARQALRRVDRAHPRQARRGRDREDRRRSSRGVPLLDRQQAFAYTQEDIKFIMAPMAAAGEEPVGSMGNDSPLAVLSNKNKTLYHYFKQLFAQVTNPAIDPIREELVMSLVSFIGPKPNLLGIDEMNPPLRLEVSAAGARLLRDGEDPPHRALHRRQVQVLRARHHLSGRLGQGGDRGAPRVARARRPRTRCARATRSSSSPTGRSTASASRFRRCSRCRRSTSTWWARACAPAPASWSRPAPRARCITSRCSAATAPRRCTPISRSRRCSPCTRTDRRRGDQGDQELRQGDRQGPEEGDVQDGHLDLHVLHRRADLRGRRPRAIAGRQVLHRHHLQRRGHRPVRGRRGGDPHPPRRVRRERPGARGDARRRRRVRLARARRGAHVDARTRSPSCSSRRAPTPTRPTRNTRSSSTTSRSAT